MADGLVGGRLRVGASAYWSSRSATGYAPNWYSLCAAEINRRITGNAKLAPTMWALGQHGVAEHMLEIGCLRGDKIAALQRRGFARRAIGIDVAGSAIMQGRSGNPNIRLFVMDLNRPRLPVSSFDFILANGVLHHIAKLEACVQGLYDSMIPGGMLCASEFTGPQRYVYSRREVRLINEGVSMLPISLRREFDPASLAPKLAVDPSESIRTRDIEAVLRATFDEVSAVPYGGNVLMRALAKPFFAGFDPLNTEHALSLERLVQFDAEVSAREPSHHMHFIARKH